MSSSFKPGNLYRSLKDRARGGAIISQLLIQYKNSAGRSGSLTHCAACLAYDFFQLTEKQWNAESGSEYYAAMLAYLVHNDLW